MPKKGASNLNLRGNNLTKQLVNGIKRVGSLSHLKNLGKGLGPIGIALGLMDTSHSRFCASDSSNPSCNGF